MWGRSFSLFRKEDRPVVEGVGGVGVSFFPAASCLVMYIIMNI